jgi:hypothetical protein
MGFNYKAHGGLIGTGHKPSPHPDCINGMYDTNTRAYIKHGFPRDVVQYTPFNDLAGSDPFYAKTYISSTGGTSATLLGLGSYPAWERNVSVNWGNAYSGYIVECDGAGDKPPNSPVGHATHWSAIRYNNSDEVYSTGYGQGLHENDNIALFKRYQGTYTNISWEFFFYMRGTFDTTYTFKDQNNINDYGIAVYGYVHPDNINYSEGPLVRSYYTDNDSTTNERIYTILSHDDDNVFTSSSEGHDFSATTGQNRWIYTRIGADLINRKVAIHQGRCTDDSNQALTTVDRVKYDSNWNVAGKTFSDIGVQILGPARVTGSYYQDGGTYRGGISELIIRVDDPDHDTKNSASTLTIPTTSLESTF